MDNKYMKLALAEALKIEAPYGCVIIKNGNIISKTYSGLENDPTGHAEIKAIREASIKLGTKDLSGCILYTTCEPCAMCFTAIARANIKELKYGISLNESTAFYDKEILIDSTHLNEIGNLGIKIHGGILKDEIMNSFKRLT